MKDTNRDWIANRCIYDLLCHINTRNYKYCIVTKINGNKDLNRCKKYLKCGWREFVHYNGYALCEVCNFNCPAFYPECEHCIQDFLNERKK